MARPLFWAPRFEGLPAAGFEAFAIPDRVQRRRAIVEAFHPHLKKLADDLETRLEAPYPLHAHLPRLDWPPNYEPFCTWLALSRMAQGYQAGPQLNVGIHADHVAIRMGWDTQAAAFGRFEFLTLHAGLGDEMIRVARENGLAFRVYAAARWPRGSQRVFESNRDWRGAFREVERRGVWFELGIRREIPEALEWAGSPQLGEDAFAVFGALLPLYDRATGQLHGD